MHIVYNLGFLLAAWKWGDWRNWQKYYPTILYFIMGDLLNNFVNFKRHFWFYHGNILPNHTIVSLLIMFVTYPATVLIYLGEFPKDSILKKVLWWGLWVFAYAGIEFINERYLNLISYDNGWNFGWSVLFNMFIFILLRVHQVKPVLAWAISIVYGLFLVTMFHLSFADMK
jgi:hypothetical protein